MAAQVLGYKSALITGASSGLGRELTLLYAAQGLRCYALARRAEELAAVRAEAAGKGGEVIPIVLDLRNYDAAHERIARLDQESGGLDLVIANAGLGGFNFAADFSWELGKQMLEVNGMGAAATLCAVIPGMVKSNRGHLVGISSIGAFRGMNGTAMYSGSKAMLGTMLESFRVELKHKSSIKITCVYLGGVRTPMTAELDMPFMLSATDAASRVAAAIAKGAAEAAFPWQTAMFMKALKWMPNAVFDYSARKFSEKTTPPQLKPAEAFPPSGTKLM
jgi:short-subunit dehydrogenase